MSYQPLMRRRSVADRISTTAMTTQAIVKTRETAPGHNPDSRYIEVGWGQYRYIHPRTRLDRINGSFALGHVYLEDPEHYEPAQLPEDY